VTALACRLTGFGAALPARRETNDDLAAHLDTSDAWIRTRTGIAARHVAVAESTSDLAIAAALEALADADVAPADLDLIVVATSTPDSACPATAARVAAALDTPAAAFDINGACTGFVHALAVASSLLGVGALGDRGDRLALVVGADRYRSLTDPADRTTTVLFGDGAGAAVLRTGDHHGAGLLGLDLRGDPDGLAALQVRPDARWLHMDGPEVFRRAVRSLVSSAGSALERAGVAAGDVDRFIPHQANVRIVDAVAGRLGIAADRVELDLVDRANTSAASIPLALHSAVRGGRLQADDRVLLGAVGAGMGAGSVLLRWPR